jgi:hypothetical protein
MDYPIMQDQTQEPPSGQAPGSRPHIDLRRRGVIAGGLLMLVGLVLLIRPLWRQDPLPASSPPAPSEGQASVPTTAQSGTATPPDVIAQGSDAATLARYISLPATPTSMRWIIHGKTARDGSQASESPISWLEATLAFTAADAKRITGVETFFKAPLLRGKLIRIDETHFRLVLNGS